MWTRLIKYSEKTKLCKKAGNVAPPFEKGFLRIDSQSTRYVSVVNLRRGMETTPPFHRFFSSVCAPTRNKKDRGLKG